MNEFFDALGAQAFLQNALIGGVLASVGCGIIGTFVVVKRIGYLAGGIAHSVLGGMGIAYFFRQDPVAGATVAALVGALVIGWVNLRWKQHEDVVIGALWSTGMATGILFISQTPGYNIDLMSYLFGNILMVPRGDILLMMILDGIIIGVVVLFYKQFLAICFDEEFARIRGINVNFFYLLLLCMVALTVVALIRVVGLILVIALLTLPPAIAAQYVRGLRSMMFVAAMLGAVFTSLGLALSYETNLPSGATMILLAGLAYLASTSITGLLQKWHASRGTG